MMRIHVAILAAGQSLRYGSEDKLSEQVGGKSLLTILLEKIQRISAPWKGCTVLVVSRELAKLCTDGPEICVVNGDPKRGISHSIQLALDVVQNSPHWMPGDAVCFCVCDQPFLKQGTLENMLEGYLKSGKGIGCIDRGGPNSIFQSFAVFPETLVEKRCCAGIRRTSIDRRRKKRKSGIWTRNGL